MKPFTATARLQFHKDFTLDAAAALVPYFASIGISHLYASPLLKSRPGSTHGYDIVDHNQIDPELGSEAALHRLVAELRRHDMGLVLDIVPNHMGVGGADNEWWLDVLEWGRASAYAEYFDIDWDPPNASLRGRMLAPFLGSPYGECLQNKDLTLQFDPADGRFFVGYYTHRFPINPRDYPSILLTGGGPLEEPARKFGELSATNRDAMRSEAAAAREALRAPELAQAIGECLRDYDPGTDAGRDRLHRLLERQNYRLSWWRAATDEINWRRFFDVNGLAGVRAEVPAVFDDTHRTILRLYTEGLIDAVRIDHVDGLADPRGYCRKLRRQLDTAQAHRAPELRQERAGLWIEKILAPQESLATEWLTDGTTGYDYMNDVAAVLHDPAGEAPLTALWTGLTGRPAAFETEAMAARRQILRESLSSELFATAAAIHRIARRDLSTRDYTLTAIRRTLVEILVHFHVYRIYAGLGGMSDTDKREMDWAMAGARRTVRPTDRDLLELLGGWLSGDGIRQVPAGSRRQERLRRDGEVPTAFRADGGQIGGRHDLLPLRSPDLPQRGRDRAVAVRALPGGLPRRHADPAQELPARAAGHRHPRPQARRRRPRPPGRDQRGAGRVGSGAGTLDAVERAVEERPGRPRPGCLRRDHALREHRRGLAARPVRRGPRGRGGAGGAARRLAGEGAARRQAPHRLGCAERGVRGGLPRLPAPDHGPGPDLPHVAGDRRVRGADRRGRRGQRPVPGAAARHLARRAGPVPGHGVLGFQPGRPGQPPPGGFRGPGRPRSTPTKARPPCCRTGRTAG